MRPVTVEQLDALLSRAAIRVPAPTLGIGRQLIYRETPRLSWLSSSLTPRRRIMRGW